MEYYTCYCITSWYAIKKNNCLILRRSEEFFFYCIVKEYINSSCHNWSCVGRWVERNFMLSEVLPKATGVSAAGSFDRANSWDVLCALSTFAYVLRCNWQTKNLTTGVKIYFQVKKKQQQNTFYIYWNYFFN